MGLRLVVIAISWFAGVAGVIVLLSLYLKMFLFGVVVVIVDVVLSDAGDGVGGMQGSAHFSPHVGVGGHICGECVNVILGR